MSSGRHHHRAGISAPLHRHSGLTLIEMLVAVVLTVGILGITGSVTQMVVARYRQMQRLETQAQESRLFRLRLELEARELVTLHSVTDREWVFSSAWRPPGEPWSARRTRLSCDKDAQNQWHLILAHQLTPTPLNQGGRPAVNPRPQPFDEWQRLGPLDACGIEVALVKPSPSGSGTNTDWTRPDPAALQGATVQSLRVVLQDAHGHWLPWVLHAR